MKEGNSSARRMTDKSKSQGHQNNLKPIYCIGETLEVREAGKILDIVQEQVR